MAISPPLARIGSSVEYTAVPQPGSRSEEPVHLVGDQNEGIFPGFYAVGLVKSTCGL